MEANKCIIAGLRTLLCVRKSGIIDTQARAYQKNFEGEPDAVVGVTDEFIQAKKAEYPHLSLQEIEYMWTGELFYRRLLSFDGCLLHASAVVYEDKAYLFSAPSGTGKSTHTQLWLRRFGESAYIINDDKPVLRMEGDRVMVYGTPWSGKTDQNRNTGVPLRGICFIERSAGNWIEGLDVVEASYRILNQTIRPHQPEEMEKLLLLLDRILQRTNVYRMGCNISTEAVEVAYEGMNKPKREE